ncbi:mechanosensitive ion channel [Candidatus Saccharibacteria bacterium]|nr:mechanosensitive ion channel [Candidatus Saccharibacteria bacterium]PZM98905.1 MAG: mechanosensitive ion channel protein MscS [Pseudomonadota bacterium]
MHWTPIFDFFGGPALAIVTVVICAALAGLLVQIVATKLITRLVARSAYLSAFLRRSIRPMRVLLPLFAVQSVLQTLDHERFTWVNGVQHLLLVLIVLTVTWLAIQAVLGIRDVAMLRFPVDRPDNLDARRVWTQATVLTRVTNGVILLIGVAIALMTFPSIRQVGASLLASAGLAGIVVGFAARPVLGNLIAGLQIAMSQPIRIDDVVIVEGEWGRIEEISGTYVVVKIWDERRLIVPLQWFIENPFQNWTRTGANILGSVFLWVDYRMPLEPLREELKRICESAPEWDGRVMTLQVTDANERAMQIRALASAGNSGDAWNLRCRIREGLITYIQREFPEALPHVRAQVVEPAGNGASTATRADAEAIASLAVSDKPKA